MITAQIRTDDAKARRWLRGVTAGLHSDALKQVAGRAGVNLTRRHLRKLDGSRPNKLGGRRSHFFSKAAAATAFVTVAVGAEISIAQEGFRYRYVGGQIFPVNAKALAIPAAAYAYGYSPREIQGLEAFFFRGRKAFGGLKDKQGRVWFWLTKKIPYDGPSPGDKTLLPTDNEYANAAGAAMASYAHRQMERNRG